MLEKIVFKVGEKEISLTAEEARSLYADLKKLFGETKYDPFEKLREFRNPWQPPVYGPITCEPGTANLGPRKPGEVIWVKGDTE